MKGILVIATPLIILVRKLIGTSTVSSIIVVSPQYPVCGLSFPFPNKGVILILALILDPSFFKKYVLPINSPILSAVDNHVATFWMTISPGEKIETLFFPMISSFL